MSWIRSILSRPSILLNRSDRFQSSGLTKDTYTQAKADRDSIESENSILFVQ
jgi:hypothetical protein